MATDSLSVVPQSGYHRRYVTVLRYCRKAAGPRLGCLAWPITSCLSASFMTELADTSSRHHPWRAPSTARRQRDAAERRRQPRFGRGLGGRRDRLARARRRGALGVQTRAALRTPQRTAQRRACRSLSPRPAFIRLAERIRPVCWGADGGRDGDLQCTVNEYLPGQGISPHIDEDGAFGDGLVAVTLGAGCAIWAADGIGGTKLGAPSGCRAVRADPVGRRATPTRTASCPARGDLVDGEWRLRGRRVSLTFRRLPPPGPCACSFPVELQELAIRAGDCADGHSPTRLRGSAGGVEPRGCDPVSSWLVLLGNLTLMAGLDKARLARGGLAPGRL